MSNSESDKNRELLRSGEIVLQLPVEPVSLQASRKKKEVITSEIRQITSDFSFILVEDVQIDILWQIREQNRYESNSSPDVDNILKPILDALCGPSGILIDDCQVQAVSCHWIDWSRSEQQITIRIKMIDDSGWTLKKGLVFVHMGKGLCYPIHLDKYALNMLESFERQMVMSEKRLADGFGYYNARRMRSVQRVFHISKLQGFEIFKIADLKPLLLDKYNEAES